MKSHTRITSILVSILKERYRKKVLENHIVLQVFCLSMVFYEIYSGTRKYISGPVATTSFSTDAEIPSLTLCHQRGLFKIGVLPPFKLTNDDYENGKFFPEPNTSELEAEEIFQKSLNDNYYLLDITGLNNRIF